MTEQDLMNVLGNAQVLCSAKGDAIINEARKGVDPYSDTYESKYKGELPNKVPQSTLKKNSKLNFIYEDMAQNPIDVNNFDESPEMNRIANSKYMQQVVQESKTVPQQVPQQQYNAPAGVDYSIIRAIVNECLENKLGTRLNEGKLNGILLKGGKITLTDNKGNIYESKLEKVGNLED